MMVAGVVLMAAGMVFFLSESTSEPGGPAVVQSETTVRGTTTVAPETTVVANTEPATSAPPATVIVPSDQPTATVK